MDIMEIEPSMEVFLTIETTPGEDFPKLPVPTPTKSLEPTFPSFIKDMNAALDLSELSSKTEELPLTP
ncbi:unnamed protein product, partial [Allacma fusca]